VPALITWWTLDVRSLAPAAHNDTVTAVGSSLLARWTEPARRYHTTTHLVEMFWALEDLELAGAVDDRGGTLGRVAAWFHDAVYDPQALPGANEAASADLARESLRQLGFDEGDRQTVAALVEMTAGHDLDGDEPVGAAFHDADLWVLSAPEERFDEYCAQVREEYAHVDEDAYRAGRAAILEPLLHRDRIYRTTAALREWEAAARVNLGRELARLR